MAFLFLQRENKKSIAKMLPSVGIELGPLITSDSKSNTLFSGLTGQKNQVVHEQKFKDLVSSTCLTSSDRRLLDLESEVMRGLGSIRTGLFFVLMQ